MHLPPGRLERLEKLEQLRALEHGMRIAVLLTEGEPPKGIDTESDYRAFVGRWRSSCPRRRKTEERARVSRRSNPPG